MSDSRARVALSKPVNLAQLAAEAGGPLVASAAEVVSADGALSQAALQVALDAHTPDPNYGKPAEDVGLSAIRAKAQQVAAGDGTFTAAQVQKILAHLILRATR